MIDPQSMARQRALSRPADVRPTGEAYKGASAFPVAQKRDKKAVSHSYTRAAPVVHRHTPTQSAQGGDRESTSQQHNFGSHGPFVYAPRRPQHGSGAKYNRLPPKFSKIAGKSWSPKVHETTRAGLGGSTAGLRPPFTNIGTGSGNFQGKQIAR